MAFTNCKTGSLESGAIDIMTMNEANRSGESVAVVSALDKGFETAGTTQYVNELEMWLKSLECYFRVANLPMTEAEMRQITLRDYSEELDRQ